jgi:hypothetical protein
MDKEFIPDSSEAMTAKDKNNELAAKIAGRTRLIIKIERSEEEKGWYVYSAE